MTKKTQKSKKDIFNGISEQSLSFVDSIMSSFRRTFIYKGMSFIVDSKVFPFDRSSRVLADYLQPIAADNVLDIGTGSGIQAIIVALGGAKKVLATDVDPLAVGNARRNVKKLGLSRNIDILKSDLFASILLQPFDLIIANLPFSNCDYGCEISHLLFDSGYKLHERFLSQAKKYLSKNGRIILVGGSLGDERTLHSLFVQYRYKILKATSIPLDEIKWTIYELGVCDE